MEGSASHARWMSVDNVMTKDVICLKASTKVLEAWILMMEADISGAPIVSDSGELRAVLSVTDIYRAILDRLNRARALRGARTESSAVEEGEVEKEELRELSITIRAVAESQVISIVPKEQKILFLSPGDSLDRAIHVIAEHNVNRLPVVKDGQVVGILTRQDIIWTIAGRPKTST
jgi:CBS domain-containing protein